MVFSLKPHSLSLSLSLSPDNCGTAKLCLLHCHHFTDQQLLFKKKKKKKRSRPHPPLSTPQTSPPFSRVLHPPTHTPHHITCCWTSSPTHLKKEKKIIFLGNLVHWDSLFKLVFSHTPTKLIYHFCLGRGDSFRQNSYVISYCCWQTHSMHRLFLKRNLYRFFVCT